MDNNTNSGSIDITFCSFASEGLCANTSCFRHTDRLKSVPDLSPYRYISVGPMKDDSCGFMPVTNETE